jgi:hypothetical protein
MKISLLLLTLLVAPFASAFPPAPHHTLYGVVKNEQGTPLSTGDATIILSGPNGEVIRAPVDAGTGRGINYTLRVPMDGKRTAQLYSPAAMTAATPFTIQVLIGETAYLPIQMQGTLPNLGDIAGSTRLDLTLGVDSDGDGIPDAWERNMIDFDPEDGLNTLADVRPGDDFDRDGLSNLSEYLAGTYAFDRLDGLKLAMKEVVDEVARLEFVVVTGHTYRLTSSTDASNWADQPFSVNADASDPVPYLRADSVTVLNVYVPVGETPSVFFKLYVE